MIYTHEDIERMLSKRNILDLAPHEYLQVVLSMIIQDRDVNVLGHKLINHFKTPAAVMNSSVEELQKVAGLSVNEAVFLLLIPEFARRIADEYDREDKRPVLDSAALKVRFSEICSELNKEDGGKEKYIILLLDDDCKEEYYIPVNPEGLDDIIDFRTALINIVLQTHKPRSVMAHYIPYLMGRITSRECERAKTAVGVFIGLGTRMLDYMIIGNDTVTSLMEEGKAELFKDNELPTVHTFD